MALTIVVPIIGPLDDPDGFSEQALPVARAVASRRAGRVILVSVMAPEDALETAHDVEVDLSGSTPRVVDERRTYLAALARDFAPLHVDIEIRAGDAASELLDLLAGLDDALVVMASKGRRGLRRMFLGSVTFELVQYAACPVVVVPVRDDGSGAHAGSLERVLVPLDLSPDSERAADVAVALLGPGPLQVRLLHVIVPLQQRASRHAARYYAIARERALVALREAQERLVQAGHDVTLEVRQGATAPEIAAAADAFDAGAIAMASYGRSGFGRIIFGSVSEDVARLVARPILVVPARR
jgi:nucleotide-binding universal stress UspA family protein